MSDHLQKVSAGAPFRPSARLQNDTVDTVRDYLRRKRGGGGGALEDSFRASVVPVKNGTGGDLARYSVVGIEGATDDPADDEAQFLHSVRLKGRAPVGEDDAGKFAVYVESGVADGCTGNAVISGVVLVKVDAGDGSTFADVAAGVTDSLIATASGSATILWRKSGTGKQWAVVRLGGGGGAEDSPEYFGQVHMGVANLTKGWALLPLVNVVPT